MFQLLEKTEIRRRGVLYTPHGNIETPFFMPIATRGAVKNLAPEDLEEIGAQIVLGNTYHLWLRPGDEIIRDIGGLHKFMNWKKPILTDSGGFQVFSLGKFAKFSEEGVEFKNPENGDKRLLTPEKSIEIQLNLGADIIMSFDECTPWDCDYKYAKESMERSMRWAERGKKYFESKIDWKSENRPLLFGIVQGNRFQDLRKASAECLVEIGFDGYAIGGADTIYGTHEQMIESLGYALENLPEDKPRYYMGVGKPEDIVAAVALGVDMFDCVIPTRNARHGSLFVHPLLNDSPPLGGAPTLEGGGRGWCSRGGVRGVVFPRESKNNFYSTLQITNSKYKNDFSPIDPNCNCYTCRNFSRAYIKHLLDVRESFGMKLATIHNLKFYLDLMKTLRK